MCIAQLGIIDLQIKSASCTWLIIIYHAQSSNATEKTNQVILKEYWKGATDKGTVNIFLLYANTNTRIDLSVSVISLKLLRFIFEYIKFNRYLIC